MTGREAAAPSFDVIISWVQGRLEPDEAAPVTSLLEAGDPHVTATVDWVRRFLDVAGAVPLPEPPPIVGQRLVQMFRRWAKAQSALNAAPSEEIAHLIFDSRQDLATAGARAGADSPEHVNLAYVSSSGDLLVNVHPTGSGLVRVEGQVLLSEPQDAAVFEATISAETFARRSIDGDDLGRFTVVDVPVSTCSLTVSNGIVSIRADLMLGSEED